MIERPKGRPIEIGKRLTPEELNTRKAEGKQLEQQTNVSLEKANEEFAAYKNEVAQIEARYTEKEKQHTEDLSSLDALIAECTTEYTNANQKLLEGTMNEIPLIADARTKIANGRLEEFIERMRVHRDFVEQMAARKERMAKFSEKTS